MSSRKVLKLTHVNRYLVGSRWCSGITGTITKFHSASFPGPLSSQFSADATVQALHEFMKKIKGARLSLWRPQVVIG